VGGTGSIIAIWVGRLSAALLVCSGASHLWPPPPPLYQELHTMFLCVAALVPLTIAEFIAFYVAMLEMAPKTSPGLKQVRELQHQAFSPFRDGAAAIKQIYDATVGRLHPHQTPEVRP
jgi:hypothetical protein